MCNFERIFKLNIVDDPKQNRLKELQRRELFESELDEILDRLGITFSEDFNLILHNDSINTMLHVVISLTEVLALSNEMSLRKMIEAHEKGRSTLKNGNLDELHYLKIGLEHRGLTITLEHAE
jgi:ATP-dependent Clp protease adapter protein ClpS